MHIELDSAYNAKKFEDKIYKEWEKSGSFSPKAKQSFAPAKKRFAKLTLRSHASSSECRRRPGWSKPAQTLFNKQKPFTIAMPPPNATGILHLGHATMLALEDIMIRHHRMLGDTTLWIPGTDHAGIATQSVVEKQLQAKGITNPRKKLGREKLLKEMEKFVEKSKSNIRNQIKKMGSSCDWSREKYTLDKDMNLAVNTLFERMHKDGLIYRGGRIVNWDPKMQTTVADDELEYKEEKTKFYYFQYGPVVIGTARPETKFMDKIIVVNPKDKRYKKLLGKEFEVEWIEGKVKAKVIGDECVDMKLGTGAMTITPAHSLIDFELAQKYKLESPQIIDFEGKIRKDVSREFGGMPIAEARQKIVEKLEKKGLLVKVDENYIHNIAVNYRGKGTIEPQVMKQWFVDVNKKAINWKGNKASIKDVLQDTIRSKMIKIVPNRFEKIYFHWIDNLKDWCISRQIWWGHQIPMWYKVDKKQYQAFKKEKDVSSFHLELLGIGKTSKFATSKPKTGLWIRDPDTLDTWFSSALWTFATLGWPKKTAELDLFHPTDVLETGYDILFFWVARMILASTYALRSDKIPEEKSIPFKTVYLHGLIRDRFGKKMSKSHPETCIDPLDMIEKYGTDALRLSLVIGSTPGNDMRLYEEKIAGYRNFVNKVWNGARFALLNIEKSDLSKDFTPSMIKSFADKWILTKLQKLIQEVDKDLKNFRLSDAGNKIYDFYWSSYCDWYLEISKGEHKNPAVLLHVLKTSLKLIHPFMPFVSEAIWRNISTKILLINEKWPEFDKKLIFEKESKSMELVHEIINQIRSVRAELKVEPGKKIHAIMYAGKNAAEIENQRETIMKLARLETLEIKSHGEKMKNAKNILIKNIEIYLPLSGLLDLDKEKNRLKKEIEIKENFINSLDKKLQNPGFTNNAPKEIVDKEKTRLEEEKENLMKLKKQLSDL